MSDRVLVTGATGFVGSVLCGLLAASGYTVRAALRTGRSVPSGVSEKVIVGDIGSSTDWSAALAGVDFVVHLAARVHIMREAADNAQLYEDTNAIGTHRLAAAAAAASVRRLVYLSSIKVNGEEAPDRAYAASDEPHPKDSYGLSKLHGEQYLAEAAMSNSLEYAIVRPPLVYGPGVRANFLRLMRWVDRELPLPLAAIQNRRSLVSVWTLCDLVTRLMQVDAPAASTWMVSDGEDLSTPDLIRRLAAAMNRRARLLPVPTPLLRLGGGLVGKSAEVSRLCGSLRVDIAETQRALSWKPPISVDDALLRTVTWYFQQVRRGES